MQIPLYIYNFANCFFPVFFTPSLTLDQWSWKTPYLPFLFSLKVVSSDPTSDPTSNHSNFPTLQPSNLPALRTDGGNRMTFQMYTFIKSFLHSASLSWFLGLFRGWTWFERFAPGSLQRLRNLSLIQPFLVTNLVQTFSQPVCVAVYLHSLWESGNM